MENKQDKNIIEICEKCGKPLVLKQGRFGEFLACSGFPKCKNTKSTKINEKKVTDKFCPECQSPLMEYGKYSKIKCSNRKCKWRVAEKNKA